MKRVNHLYSIALFILSFSFVFGAISCNSSGGTYTECGGPKQFICPSGLFCNLVNGCGGMDAGGVCRPVPTDCPNEDEPVCGCDRNTYASACYANASLQTIAYEGKCIPPS